MAFEVVKAMQADGLDWGEGYRPLGRQALEEIIEDQMAAAVDRYLDQLGADDAADRRNGYYRRHLLTELGDIELQVPRTRRYSPVEVIRAYARRTREIDRVILAGFVLGLSTRKVGETLLALLGRKVSPTTVSRVAKTLDAAVAAFHRRPLQNRYQALMLDGVVLARKTGAGLLAALPGVFHGIPVQRCWAHKIRNVLDKVRKADQPKVKRALHKIMNAPNAQAARAAARKLADRFEDKYPAAVACLRNDLDELLTCFRYKSEDQRRKVRTTNAIERRFREVRRRTRPMGTFQDRTSMDRILFAVFTHENKSQGVSTPFLLKQNN
ncbi:MAG TPA: transposase [Xanthobacteraceae bacterium]|nr:transposase [Xanthobacteraceae bacterium]